MSASAPPAPARPANRVWFPGLDGLRALAAGVVVIFHLAGSVDSFQDWTLGGVLVRFGNWGVAVFFVLSGFLLFRPFVAADLRGGPPPSWRVYLERRLARIVPAYWLALTVLLFVIREDRPDGLLPYGLFYGFAQNYKQGYVDTGGGLSVAWTLCIEMAFYLLVPVAAWALRGVSRGASSVTARARVQLLCIGSVALASVFLRWWVIREHPIATFWLPSYLLWFGLGMSFAVWHARAAAGGPREPAVLWTLGRYPELSWLLGLAVFGVTTLLPVRAGIQTRSELLVIFVANGLSAALLLAPVVFGQQTRGPLRAFLASRPLRWLGEISYGTYLWHTIWLTLAVRWVADGSLASGFWYRFVVVVALTLASAWLSHRFVERPLLAVAHRRTAPALPPGPNDQAAVAP